MTEYSNSKLIYELVDSIIIFDSVNSITFKGCKISEVLLQAGVDLTGFCSEPGNVKPELQKLCAIVDEVRISKQPQTYEIENLSREFVLFPAGFNGGLEVILALKDKISHINKIEHDLAERGKELKCLYNVSRELESSKPLDEVFDEIAHLVKTGFQFPAYTRVLLRINKNFYGYKEILLEEKFDVLQAEIKLGDKNRGELKVFLDKGYGFIAEEVNLINEVAGKISRALEKQKKTINLEKQKKILMAKNEALLKITDECNKRRQKLRTFFSAITDPIIVIDTDYNITMSNKEEIGDSGRCYEKLFNRKEKCVNCPAALTFKEARNNFYEFEDNGFNYILRSYPILDKKGNAERVLEVCRDVTTQKKLEEQLTQSSKLASLGKLVAGVAHEINNPNTFILGNLKIIEEAFKDIFPILDEYYKANSDLKIARLNYGIFKDNIEVLVKDMINGANRTKKIVADLRNFAKKDEGQLTEEVDLNFIINNNLTLTRKHVKKYGAVEIDLEDELPLFKGNSQRIEQVLLNLIINASEAIEDKEDGVISIQTRFDAKSNEVKLVISDNGYGMDEHTRKNIFDPFYTTKRDKGGTGLGLSITYGIIKEHNGNIEVDSRHNEGTAFTIRIPAIKTEE